MDWLKVYNNLLIQAQKFIDKILKVIFPLAISISFSKVGQKSDFLIIKYGPTIWCYSTLFHRGSNSIKYLIKSWKSVFLTCSESPSLTRYVKPNQRQIHSECSWFQPRATRPSISLFTQAMHCFILFLYNWYRMIEYRLYVHLQQPYHF